MLPQRTLTHYQERLSPATKRPTSTPHVAEGYAPRPRCILHPHRPAVATVRVTLKVSLWRFPTTISAAHTCAQCLRTGRIDASHKIIR